MNYFTVSDGAIPRPRYFVFNLILIWHGVKLRSLAESIDTDR